MRVWAISVAALGLASVAACNALTGASDLELGEPDEDAGVVPTADARFEDVVAAADADVKPLDAGADAPLRPAYCTGITFYAPFDDSLQSKAGQAAEPPPIPPTYVAGRYGKAIDLSLAPNQIYYASTFAGKPTYAVAKGTVAFWLKPTWTPPCVTEHTIFKPKLDKNVGGTPTAGPIVSCSLNAIGLTVEVPVVAGALPSTAPTVTPEWAAGQWNLVVGTWDQAKPNMTLFASATVMSSTSTAWTPIESPAGVFRIGAVANPPQAAYDELVIWDRELGRMDVEQLRAATKSVADACGL